jgi:ribosomal protein L40E
METARDEMWRDRWRHKGTFHQDERWSIFNSMYCVICGSHNPEHGKFCQECGNRLVRTKSELVPRASTENELLLEVLRTDSKPNKCHRCGAETDLTRHGFAIGKVISMKREWGETIAHVGLSAVSIVAAPVTGFGVFGWKSPKKTTSFKLFKAELVLCSSCLSWAWRTRHSTELKEDAYRLHPWAEKARSIGYDKYLSAEEVARLKPAR